MRSGPDRSAVYQRWTRLFVALIGAGCLIGIAIPAGLGWDFANFYDAGRRVAAGQIPDLYSPLSLINGLPPQGRTGFFGAPISALFYLPLAPFSAETALVLFKVENVLAYAATFGILLAFYRPLVSGDDQARAKFTALFAFLCLIYQPFWTVFRVGGQTTATVLLLLSLGLVAHTRGRLWISALSVVVAALIKPSLAPTLILLGGLTGVAYVVRLAAVMAVVGALSLVVMGWPVHLSFLDLMARSSKLTYPWYFNSSIYVVVENLRVYAGPDAARVPLLVLTYALKASVVLTVLWLAWRSRREPWTDAARRHADFLLAVVFFLLWSPTIWEHYLSLLFPLLIFVVASSAHFSRQALILVALIFVLSLGQNLIVVNWFRYGFSFESLPALVGIALFKSAPLLLTLWLLWRHAHEWLRSHALSRWES